MIYNIKYIIYSILYIIYLIIYIIWGRRKRLIGSFYIQSGGRDLLFLNKHFADLENKLFDDFLTNKFLDLLVNTQNGKENKENDKVHKLHHARVDYRKTPRDFFLKACCALSGLCHTSHTSRMWPAPVPMQVRCTTIPAGLVWSPLPNLFFCF